MNTPTDLLAERPSDDNRAPYRPPVSDRERALANLARLRATLTANRPPPRRAGFLVRAPGVTRASRQGSQMMVHRAVQS